MAEDPALLGLGDFTVVNPRDYRLIVTVDLAGLMSIRTQLPRAELLALLLNIRDTVLTTTPVGGTPDDLTDPR